MLSESFSWPVAFGAMSSPWWLTALQETSTVSALLLAPLGVVLAVLKIAAHVRGNKSEAE